MGGWVDRSMGLMEEYEEASRARRRWLFISAAERALEHLVEFGQDALVVEAVATIQRCERRAERPSVAVTSGVVAAVGRSRTRGVEARRRLTVLQLDSFARHYEWLGTDRAALLVAAVVARTVWLVANQRNAVFENCVVEIRAVKDHAFVQEVVQNTWQPLGRYHAVQAAIVFKQVQHRVEERIELREPRGDDARASRSEEVAARELVRHEHVQPWAVGCAEVAVVQDLHNSLLELVEFGECAAHFPRLLQRLVGDPHNVARLRELVAGHDGLDELYMQML